MHIKKQRLLTPGPTPLYPKALHAMMGSDIHHRTEDFRNLYRTVLADLKEVLGTSNDVLTLVASGTGAMEASVQNLFSAGDKVIVCSAGKFGERWVEITKAYGLDSVVLSAEYGDVVSPDRVEKALYGEPGRSRRVHTGVGNLHRRIARHQNHGGGRAEDGRDLCDRRYHRHGDADSRYRWMGTRRGDRRLAEGFHDSARTRLYHAEPTRPGPSPRPPNFRATTSTSRRNARTRLPANPAGRPTLLSCSRWPRP